MAWGNILHNSFSGNTMERDHRHVDLSCVPSTLQSCDIDWTSCILCQLNTKEPLTCPGVGTSGGQGYSSFAENLVY